MTTRCNRNQQTFLNQLLIESEQSPVEKQQQSSPFISKFQLIFKKPF